MAEVRRYHYLSTDLHISCKCFGVFDGDNQVAFIAVHHFPHPNNAKIKMVSRLVVLPDYQGIGIGYKFLCIIAQLYKDQGYDFRIMTSAKNLINKLYKSDKWCMTRKGIASTKSKTRMLALDKTIRSKCMTASFKYRG